MSQIYFSGIEKAGMVIIGYLFGSFPFGLIVAKALGNIDPREHGSGNIGATNVARLLGARAGFYVLFLDLIKSFIPVSISIFLFSRETWIPYLVAFAAVSGHSYSIFLKFRGGKGMSAGLGAILPLFPDGSIFSLLIFLVMVSITRYVSLGSLSAATALVIYVFIKYGERTPACVFALLSAVIIFVRHKDNIKRLLRGEENKFSFRKKQ